MTSRREKEKRKQRREAAMLACEEAGLCPRDGEDPDEDPSRQLPATPSEYGIKSFEERIASDPALEEVYSYGRVSTRKQDLARQLKGCRRRIEAEGVKVRHAYGEVASGKTLDLCDRRKLVKALEAARTRGDPLVMVCVSRAVRHCSYDAHRNPEARPTVAEFEAFRELADGVEILTLNDPDASPPEDENFLRELVASVKRRPVGRPRKKKPGHMKDRSKRWKKRAKLMHEEGMSYREIADYIYEVDGIRITHGTIWNWVAGAGMA
jgi:hypothetical protein